MNLYNASLFIYQVQAILKMTPTELQNSVFTELRYFFLNVDELHNLTIAMGWRVTTYFVALTHIVVSDNFTPIIATHVVALKQILSRGLFFPCIYCRWRKHVQKFAAQIVATVYKTFSEDLNIDHIQISHISIRRVIRLDWFLSSNIHLL